MQQPREKEKDSQKKKERENKYLREGEDVGDSERKR